MPISHLVKISEKAKIIIFFTLIFAGLFLLQYSPDSFGDPDGYFHVKTAQLLIQNGTFDTFPWISETTWAVRFADHYFLYHVLLYPFTLIDPIVGTEILNALLGTAIAAMFFQIARHFHARHPYVWTVLLLVASQNYLLRLLVIKAVPLGSVLLLASTYALLKKNYSLLFLTSFLVTLSYGGFIFLPPILGLYFISTWLVEKKPYFKLPLTSLSAIGIALLVHPGLRNLPAQLYTHIFQAGLGYVVPVGDEWSFFTIKTFLSGNMVALIIWLTAIFFTLDRFSVFRKNKSQIFLMLTSVMFFLLAIKSQRFIEYWIPFAFIASLEIVTESDITEKILNYIKKSKNNLISFAPLLLALACLALVMAFTVYRSSSIVKSAPKVTLYEPAAQALLQASNPGDIVFNTQWDEFPMLFFSNSDNYYVTGLDPMFMYGRNAQIYWLWRHISEDNEFTCNQEKCGDENKKDIADTIINDFNAKYVFLSKKRSPRLEAYLSGQDNVNLIFSDDFSSVYKLLP